MRSIKFRAFNQQNGIMEVIQMRLDGFGPDIKCRWDYDKGTYQEAEFTNSEQATKDGGKKACILMQFTGLLDKNGKEIYESDIVKARHGRNDYEGYSIIKGEIKFENGQWLIGDYVMNYQNDNFEVIGNIYEPPAKI